MSFFPITINGLGVTHSSPKDFSVAFTSNVSVTASGASFTIDDTNCTIAYIYYKPTGGQWQQPLINGQNGVSIVAASGVLTVAGAGTPFASADQYLVGLIYQNKSFASAANANQQTRLNPAWAQLTPDTLIDETDITTNTTSYAYIDMEGFRHFSLQGETSGTAPTDVLTVTIEATNQDDGTAAASCTYQDVTSSLFGVASFVDTDFFVIADTIMTFKYVRVKYVTSNDAGNDADLTVYARRIF